MSSSRIIRLILMLLLFLGIVAYIIYIITRKPKGYTQEVCNGIVLTIAEDPRANFISEKTIEEILSKVKINPVGRLMKDINLQEIEKTIRLNQYVDSVECYKTANGKVCVRVSQRTPVIYVIPDSASSGYYVDSQETSSRTPVTQPTYLLPLAILRGIMPRPVLLSSVNSCSTIPSGTIR